MAIDTRYEVAYTDAAGKRTIIGATARKSAIGLRELIIRNTLAQCIVDSLPEDSLVARGHVAWVITAAEGAPIGRFHFTGGTIKHPDSIGARLARTLEGRAI